MAKGHSATAEARWPIGSAGLVASRTRGSAGLMVGRSGGSAGLMVGRSCGSAREDREADRKSCELGDTTGILGGEDDGNKLA